MKTRKLITFCILLLGSLQFYCQNSIVTSGGDAKGNGGSVSFSIGQLATANIPGLNGTVSEGVQYPHELFIVNETDNLVSGLTIYPNPTSEFLIVKFIDAIPETTSAILYNMEGQVLDYKAISDKETIIDVSGLQPATYLLIFINKNKLLKTFKIIKIEKS